MITTKRRMENNEVVGFEVFKNDDLVQFFAGHDSWEANQLTMSLRVEEEAMLAKANALMKRVAEGYLPLYLDTLSPLAASKAEAALRKMQGFNGRYMARFEWVKAEWANLGTIDHERQRLNFKDGGFMFFSDVTKTVINYIEFARRMGA